MTRLLLSIVLVISSAGCSKLAKIDELLTLKSVADSQTAMAKDVEATNKLFDSLKAAVENGKIMYYKDQAHVRKDFGPPILERQEIRNEKIVTTWLYRYATEYFNADKVYLYFDASGKLIEWQGETVKPGTGQNGGKLQ